MNACKLPAINNDKLRNWWDGRTPEQKYQDIGVTFREKNEGDAENRVGGDLNFDPTLVNDLHELHQPHPPEMMSCDNYLHGESEIRLRFSTSSFTKLRCSRSQPLSVVVSARCLGESPAPRVLGTTQDLQIDLSAIGSVKVEWVEPGESPLSLNWVKGSTEVNKILVFAARCASFKKMDFVIDLYESTSCSQESHIGSARLHPLDFPLKDVSCGTVSLDVTSVDGAELGQISLSCLLIEPLSDVRPASNSTHSWLFDKKTLLGGHRGMGDCHHKDPRMSASMTENTIASLKQAGRNGADFVEFDVQLTHDLVPVIYHNFTVCVQSAATRQLIKVFVKDLTLSDLRELKLIHVSTLGAAKHEVPTVDFQDISESLVKMEEKEREKRLEERSFPTLQEVMTEVPPKLSIDVEVKYPVPEETNDHYDFPFLDRGVVADAVLRVLLPFVSERHMFLSCFDADMCTVLQLKQSCIPVFNLTTNLSPEFEFPVDPRSKTVQAAAIHARMQHFMGIVMESHQLLESEAKTLVKGVQEQELILVTWGSHNNWEENRDRQRRLGVNGIIYDRFGEGLKKLE